MSENTNTGDVYVAVETGVLAHGKERVVVHKGVTRVRAGHKLLKEHPDMFKPIDVHFDVEDRRAAPAAGKGKPGTGARSE